VTPQAPRAWRKRLIDKAYRMSTTSEAVLDDAAGLPPSLVFTDAAARKVGDLIQGEGNPNLMLRVFVQGGGCSGLQYGFEFDEQVQDGDTCVENQGVKLLVDPMSVVYLTGAEIDYREGLDGAQFVIRNPNATTTCGCGSSFST
jgi:iron-sulfur cluster insertion protein